ncbi:hypothetical protein LUZ63_000571 [Rhynchospora breviuscula]|uniref:BED-type domain-containing protein n=1 Tax=Rhynchospora breviuscula TaxID=2022672 RepID=A0A9Q0CW46_9POAL|nr:hypothetical protein LUZ63_000571 [Rhynchospora breviuscula]
MGLGLHFETPDEIQRIQEQPDAPQEQPEQDGGKTPACDDEREIPKKRKSRKTTSEVWKFFTRGPTQEDGSYEAICKFCGVKYLQGQQRGTSSMKNHIDKQCKKFPRNNHDALQKMLQAAKTAGAKILPWIFYQMKCRKGLAKMTQVPYKKPAWDVPTRWNSTYLMLELAMELKPALYRYASLDKRYNLNPTDFQWEAVKVLAVHLKVFYDATLKLSGTKYPTLNLFFTEFCDVYLTIKIMASSPYTFIVQMGADMLIKFNKYWAIGNSLLAIACVFDPRCKLVVVEYYMKQVSPQDCDSFIAMLIQCMKALFKEYVEANANAPSGQNLTDMSKRQKNADASSSVDTRKAALKDYIKEKRNSEPSKSELEDYLGGELDAAAVDEEFDILAWWKLKVPKYPILSKMARDILAVPISTVAYEATFSTSGRVLSPIRSSLNDESIEALLCAQDWLRGSITEIGEYFGDPLWNTDENYGNEE